MNKKAVQVGGIAAVVAGSVALYIGGAGEAVVTSLVGGVFVLAGIIAGIIKA